MIPGPLAHLQTASTQKTVTVKYCTKAAAYVHFFDFSGRLLYETGLCAAVVQLLAAYTVQGTHAGIQHPCVLYMTSHTINQGVLQYLLYCTTQGPCNNSIKSSFCKPWLLFRSGLCVGMQSQKCSSIREQLLFEDGFYTRLYGII